MRPPRRPRLADRPGRSTMAQRVDALLASGLLVAGADGASTGGRPPTTLAFNGDAGVVAGRRHRRHPLAHRGHRPRRRRSSPSSPRTSRSPPDPSVVLSWLERSFDRLLERDRTRPSRAPRRRRRRARARRVRHRPPGRPPIMPGLELRPRRRWFAGRFGVPALVDNDVNIMALGEHWTHWLDEAFLLFVKVGTGIGCGIVASGHVHRGADGAAGDIGHIHVPDHDDVVCQLRQRRLPRGRRRRRARSPRDCRELGLDAHDQPRRRRPGARRPTRRRPLGPAGRARDRWRARHVRQHPQPGRHRHRRRRRERGEPLLAGIREVVYQRSLPLATGHLQIALSRLGDEAGITGAAVMVLETILAPAAVDAALAAR